MCLLVIAGAVLSVASCAGDDDAENTTTTVPAVTTTSSTTSTSSTSFTTSTSITSTTTSPQLRCVDFLENGCDGEGVGRLQRLLRTRINGSVAVDGQFGSQTEGALRSFEQNKCPTAACAVDGRIVIDGPEWDALVDLPELPRPTFELSP